MRFGQVVLQRERLADARVARIGQADPVLAIQRLLIETGLQPRDQAQRKIGLAGLQIQARGMLIEQEHPVLGKVKLPNLPFRFSACDTTVKTPAPLMGQHNRSIAAGLGYSASEIDAMVQDGLLYAEQAVSRLAGQSATQESS
ncbi:MAG: CoA transferase [Burkholderiaceae bacterium]